MATLEIATRSELLGQDIDVTVVTPAAPAPGYPAPAPAASRSAAEAVAAPSPAPHTPPAPPRPCYLLHGTSQNHRAWPTHVDLARLATRYHLAFVCMSAGRSFFLNWDRGLPWTDFITAELPDLVAADVRLDLTPGAALIAGLSAGGYGAFHAALTRPDLYAAAGSFSGVLDIASAYNRPRRVELYRGAFATDEVAGTDADLMALASAHAVAGTALPRLWAACGSSDHVLPQSHAFRDHATALGLPLTYVEWEGDHEWVFWVPALEEFLAWALSDPAH
ncbi:MAG: alpha/beta hydrolase-fold protein [Actinomycetaceae bacterium]|nr:alpha/beta hydrolase-fold protein [Actinomycetaceae bacterium]MDU0969835.1 alpha/beta hydrolase-fold protein [Actinomycetaceae bacterium]